MNAWYNTETFAAAGELQVPRRSLRWQPSFLEQPLRSRVVEMPRNWAHPEIQKLMEWVIQKGKGKTR
jgi:hypothetical protein